MKKPLSFKDKAYIIYKWMLQHKDGAGLMMACGLCHSTRIKLTDSTDLIKNGINSYKGTYECQDCGAKGENTETWEGK